MQDWDGTPSFSPFILGERRAKVTVKFAMDDKSKGAGDDRKSMLPGERGGEPPLSRQCPGELSLPGTA
jgi:hypothetical protein